MVKIFFIFLLFFSFAFSGELKDETLLIQKIKTFVNSNSYEKNKDFIKLIFSPETNFYKQDRINIVKVIQTLKENGLLNLFFDKPQELKLSFKTSGSPLFFVKIMGDTLRNIGYYRYVTENSSLSNSEFTWMISLKSEYATDPLILQKELNKSGCLITDIQRDSKDNWKYIIDISGAYLNVESLNIGVEHKVKRSLYPHWLNVENIHHLTITSSFRDHWYPQISYYDKELHLLEMIKQDKVIKNLYLTIPKYTKYIKISDIYTLKNVKDNLILKPSGSK